MYIINFLSIKSVYYIYMYSYYKYIYDVYCVCVACMCVKYDYRPSQALPLLCDFLPSASSVLKNEN